MTIETDDEFIKKNPHLKEFVPFIDLLNNESDRGKVLISTGYLEQQLEDILRAFMLEVPEVDNLFRGGNAPLGNFSSRITTCYSLGLIFENEHDDLNQLRRIRNEFAHNFHTTFKTQSIIDRCANLKTKVHDYTKNNGDEVIVDTANQFQTAAVNLIMHFINRPHYVSKERISEKEWPY